VRAERTNRAKKLACVVPAAPVPSTGAFLLTTGALVVVVGSGDGSVASFWGWFLVGVRRCRDL